MKAIIQREYGPPERVLELREVERPTPAAGEVLVRVHATSAAGDDWHLVRGMPYLGRLATGLRRPKHCMAGLDLAGRIEAVGSGVARFKVGDEVFGWCDSALAEYVAVPADNLLRKPSTISLEQAACVAVSAFTALQGLRDRGELKAGQAVLINGAAGGVGTFAVQIAKSLGAEVTGVCSTRNVELLRELGADHVVDYTQEDFATGDRKYDLILDMVGNRCLGDLRRALKPKGTLVMVGGRGGPWLMGTERWLGAMLLSPFVGQRFRPLVHQDRLSDLETIRDWIEDGAITPVVDRSYPLAEIAEAIGYLEQRHARGKVGIRVHAGD